MEAEKCVSDAVRRVRRWPGAGLSLKPAGRARQQEAQPKATMATLSPNMSPRTPRRKPSTRRRALSHLQPHSIHDSHDAALHAIRSFLKLHTAYDAFPVSFRLIVLDTKLNVKKALQCLLLNGKLPPFHPDRLLTSRRRRLRPLVEQRQVKFRWHAHRSRYHPSHPVLLPDSHLRICSHRCREIPSRIIARYFDIDHFLSHCPTSFS